MLGYVSPVTLPSSHPAIHPSIPSRLTHISQPVLTPAQIPGLLHSWYIISKYPEIYEYDPVLEDGEGGAAARVTYVFVQPEVQPQPRPAPACPPHPNYGSTDNPDRSSSAGPSHDEGSRAPPTYAEAVKGDNKIQTQD